MIFTVFEMSNFVLTKQHLREVLIFCFHWKKNAAEAHRMLVEVYDDTASTDKSCREWFRRFKDGNFSVEDKPRSGQPKKFEDQELEALLEEDQSQTQEELAESLGVTQQAVSVRLGAMGIRAKCPEYEQRHDEVILLHDNACRKSGKKISGNAQMGCFTAPVVFSGHCSF